VPPTSDVSEAATARLAARYNVRPLLPGPEEALRDTALSLGIAAHELTALARYGAVEALAVEGLRPDQTRVLERAVRDGDGHLVSNADGDRVLILAPLVTAGELPGRLSGWSDTAAELGRAISDVLVARAAAPPPLNARGRRLEIGRRTLVMGVVNVTPDSFSGDGVGGDVERAVALAGEMVAAGADIIDVGGESTRPGFTEVPTAEEIARVVPVVRGIVSRHDVAVSIDSRKATVVQEALGAGAHIVNDIWGLRDDSDMARVVGEHPDVVVVLMHNKRGTEYTDLAREVAASLRESISLATRAGIAYERLVVDPGFGFGKTPAQNLELLRRLGQLRGLGRPILTGLSRKSTIGLLTDKAPPQSRLEGSLVLAALAVREGAHIVRVHDVAETVRAMRVVDAVMRGTPAEVRDLPRPGATG
jgi:dihydropteroate synthase